MMLKFKSHFELLAEQTCRNSKHCYVRKQYNTIQ